MRGKALSFPHCLFSMSLFLTSVFVYGLSLGTHLSNLAFAPAFALFILFIDWRIVRRPWVLLGGVVMFALGCLQFIWLPYKAVTLDDPLMLRNAPNTLEGIYRYTLGAFPQFKFAFPIQAIPNCIVLYMELLRQNFGVVGIVLGVYGMWEMLFHKTKKFYLFIAMYLAHVFFFVQYRAFDLEVFFIPVHFVYVIFVGYGVYRLINYACALVRRPRGRLWLNAGVALLLCLLIAGEVRANWEANDCSHDMATGDFYRNAFEILPEGSVLIGWRGVFGYDMFYWRLVYNVRLDILMPHLTDLRPSPEDLEGREIYTTMRLDSPQAGRGPWTLLPGLVELDAWHIPVLIGQHNGSIPGGKERDLVLYRVSAEPPELVVREADPEYQTGQQLGGLELVGYDLDGEEASRGSHLHLTFYWQVLRPEQALIATMLGEETLEAHTLGLGNLPRYIQEFHPPQDAIIVEDYLIVVPSKTPLRLHTLKVGLQEPLRPGQRGQSVEEVLEIGKMLVTE